MVVISLPYAWRIEFVTEIIPIKNMAMASIESMGPETPFAVMSLPFCAMPMTSSRKRRSIIGFARDDIPTAHGSAMRVAIRKVDSTVALDFA